MEINNFNTVADSTAHSLFCVLVSHKEVADIPTCNLTIYLLFTIIRWHTFSCSGGPFSKLHFLCDNNWINVGLWSPTTQQDKQTQRNTVFPITAMSEPAPEALPMCAKQQVSTTSWCVSRHAVDSTRTCCFFFLHDGSDLLTICFKDTCCDKKNATECIR
ncbi:hypothetical protein AMECASPLE_009804 [Ameca splendens]|uniref:Uncharacterized protein n=1 Tax=Ameca splendens TaxID=208324 RepID=A0ABV0YB96_9TELE